MTSALVVILAFIGLLTVIGLFLLFLPTIMCSITHACGTPDPIGCKWSC